MDYCLINTCMIYSHLIGKEINLFFMGKVKMKSKYVYPCPPEVVTLKELCNMRDSISHTAFTSAQLERLIDDICTQ